MAVVVTDTRTVISNADNNTGWTGGTAGGTVFVEGGTSIISTLNIATGQIYHTGAARNVSDTLIYVWSNNFALQSLWDSAQPPNALHIGDGTNRISFKMAGINRKVFAHLDAGSGINGDWDCLVLDGSQASVMNAAGLTVNRAGTFGALNLNAITQFGADFTTLSKGLGGGVNVAVDIIRIGNGGLIITGGNTSDRGTFSEIVDFDSSTASGRAHGIIRQLATGLYSCQGPLTFGNSSAANTSWFQETSKVLTFENRNIGNDKYFISVQGHPSADNHFILRNCIITSAGPWVGLNFNSGNINNLELSGMTFSNLGNRDIVFSSNPDASNHFLTDSSFSNCGQITAGEITISGCNFASQAGNSLLFLNSGSDNISNCVFNGNGSGPDSTHGILITTPGEYDFNDLNFVNFGSDETTSAAVYNNSGGEVIINVFGG